MSRKFSGIRNPVLLRTVLSLLIATYRYLSLLIATALFLCDTTVSPIWLIYSASAVFLLEYVNYIQHYGFHREEGEAVTEHHSWDSEARWSHRMLLELSRHSTHHLKANVPFWKSSQRQEYSDSHQDILVVSGHA